MKEELIKFTIENNLSPFNEEKSPVKIEGESIFKTRDAKSVHNRVINKISSEFFFKDTINIWSLFNFTDDISKIVKRQEFFSKILISEIEFLKKIEKPRRKWKPPYEMAIVTEDESTFIQINKLGCTVILLVSESDLIDLERYDIVQVIDCENFQIMLEKMPQTVFIDSIDNVYLERYLELLSGWKNNIEIIKKFRLSEELNEIISKLSDFFELMENSIGKIVSIEEAEKTLEKINDKISEKVKEMTISGEGLLKMLGEGKIPKEILTIIQKAIEESGYSEQIFNIKIPVEIDYEELEEQIKRQSANEFTSVAEKIKKNSENLKKIPLQLERLSALLMVEDFCQGVRKYIGTEKNFPSYSENLHFSECKNIFIENPSSISFQLDKFSRGSILTGANSGGKTTLLEHIIQNLSLFQLGLPISGEVHMPFFSEVYYFAKNKGSASKGAFETLLSQMSKINPGEQTLILADEIEAVTEPGVAGKIISATVEYFIKKNCFLVIATHLGQEIAKTLPEKTRIDGIEAKGLDKDFNLIVDHSPVMGRLAHSTPELIVERMANYFGDEYFKWLNRKIKE